MKQRSNLSSKQFKVMTIKMLKGLGTRIDEERKKWEVFFFNKVRK